MNPFKTMYTKDFVYLNSFLKSVDHYPQRTALTCTTCNRSWNYAELNRVTNQLARALIADGIKKGDVIMCSFFNTAEYVFFWLGCQKVGAVFSPINFRLAAGEVAAHIDDGRPRVYAFDADLQETVSTALSLSGHRPDRLLMGGEGAVSSTGVPFQDYMAGCSEDDCKPVDPEPFDEIVRLYTSGTTGDPKGVPLSNINNLIRSYDVLMHFPLGPMDKTLNMTPWFHAGGLHSGGPCPTLHAGGEMVALKTFSPRTVLDLVASHRLTFLVGAPVNIEMLVTAQIKEPRDLTSLKGIVAMGAPLSRDTCLRCQEVLTPRLFNGYGTTETFWNTFLRPYELPKYAGTAGRACTDDLVRVVRIDEDRQHADPDDMVPRDGKSEGEVIIQTLKAPFRYHNKPDYDEKHYSGGWYYTSDIAVWDEEGFLTICGRRDDMIISEGENIHPVQVEQVINEHPGVSDSIVVGVPDKLRGEALAAYVIREDPSLTTRELFRFLTGHQGLAKFKRPRFIQFVDVLPFTATKKKQHFVMKRRAKQELERGELMRF
jgi:long-chain acyl-CoA synthetase